MQQRILSSILLFLTTPIISFASALVESETSIGSQYRIDNLDWNIAGGPNGESPNVLSELKWRDINSFQVTFAADLTFDSGFYITTGLARGFIFDGKNCNV